MRIQSTLLLLHACFFLSCGGQPSLSSLNGEVENSWKNTAPTCNGFPSKDDCDDGDTVLFGGLLCAAGEERGCALVRQSQSFDGRWWRSPRRNPGNLGENNSFSRDAALGVLLYLIKTRDSNAAERWLSWIENNRPCTLERPFGSGCLVRGQQRFCTDDSDQRCTLTPATWGLMGRVWEYIGRDRTELMRLHRDEDGDALWMEAEHAPLGYELHLVGVEVLLKQMMGESRAPSERAARLLNDRQADNPFFNFLQYGGSDSLMNRVYDLCPKLGSPIVSSRHQWAWERDTGEAAWQHSMHWDCIFLAKLMGH